MVEKLLTEKEWKALPENQGKTVRSYRKYKRQFKKDNKEGENVGLKDVAGKLVSDVNNAINPPKPAPVVKIDFNVEVEAVVRACDENQVRVTRLEDNVTDRAVNNPSVVLADLQGLWQSMDSLKLLTGKMLASYKEADAGIAVLEKEAAEVQDTKKKLAQIRATRTREKTE